MAKLFILPGMGATTAMYDSLRSEMDFEANFIDWPEYRGETTYREVAQRLIDEHSITADDVVGGSSLGGMIALEIANVIKPKKVVLMGSAINPREVQSVLSVLSPLAAVTPVALIQVLAGKQKNLVAQMFSDSDPDFIRAMCLYLKSWQGYTGPMESVLRIHGRKDPVIPCPQSGAKVIAEGGHLIAMTHPVETGGFLGDAFNES